MNSPFTRLITALTLVLAVSATNAAEVLNLNFNEASGTAAADSMLSDGTATPDDSVTLQNGASFAAGYSGTALDMPSTTAPWAHAVFDTTSIGDLLISAPGGTFACRMMIPSALWSSNTNKDKGNLIFIGRAGSSTQLRFALQTRRNAAFRLLARCNDGDSAASIQTGTGMFQVDEWIHIAAVADYAAATLTIYTNGQIAFKTNGVTQWGGATFCSSAASTNSAVGMNWPNTDEAFIGRLDDVRFWNEPLSDAQVAELVGPAPAPPIPVITQAVVVAGSFILRGTNGTPSTSYEVLSAPSLATSSTLWPAISTNAFDAGGNFSATNPLNGTPRFYRVRTGGGGSPPPVNTPPGIVTQPQPKTVMQGSNATFTVVASGSAPLSYQWFFNSVTPLAGATSSFTLTNVQPIDGGNYSVVITNIAGAITSSPALLTVTLPVAPTITSDPTNLTVASAQTAIFNAIATGTAPLRYQWYFNGTTPVASGTNATLSLGNAQTNNSGNYHLIVTNIAGSATSLVATLTVIPPPTNAPNFDHVGFADNGTPITGGAAGPTVFVRSEAELQSYSDANTPYTIIITNSFDLTSMDTHIRDNKTVIGSNSIVLSGGGLYLYNATNVIIRNLTITGSTEDGIGLHFSENIWIDHCTITDSSDGGIDITQESDNVTVSWCNFYYSSPTLAHRLASLIASSDSDAGNYRITYHHNWWGDNVQERMPSNRFGRVHVFNNYYNAPGNNYCVRTRINAESRIENNWFENVKNPWEIYVTSGTMGKVWASGNTEVNTTRAANNVDIFTPPGTDTVFAPPYTYTLNAPAVIPAMVTGNAGAGKGPFAP